MSFTGKVYYIYAMPYNMKICNIHFDKKKSYLKHNTETNNACFKIQNCRIQCICFMHGQTLLRNLTKNIYNIL